MILDTDVLIALLNGEPASNEAIRGIEEKENKVATTVISVYEILRGAYISSDPEKNLVEIHELLANIEILELTVQACEEASKIYRDLRRKGSLIGEYDVLIAGIAVAHSMEIMTRDAHFKKVPGISTIKW